eukprot:CAMPEP_0202706056 /NCGR_PEP_ID=MMETSP1385-20130828/18537_1 /ASSEMBLY_ACC=CAM_ASM_000861 /TAXON_ID=933848 /ORGANISM="Elphidium margaritaceum" /LENGTH=240 /DNA_ID=CAMNT_0049364439 /DNA_START=32 /DNA_END=754 /DNA_ORIENTATION=-
MSMDISLDFINTEMSTQQQCDVWKDEYIKLYKKSQKEMRIVQQYQQEMEKMTETNQMGEKLIEQLQKQLSKYESADSDMDDDGDEVDVWKDRYLSEKRTSQYLRKECEDLQYEMEELKHASTDDEQQQVKGVVELANAAWEQHVISLIEENNKYKEAMEYRARYEEAMVSKLRLIEEASQEIQRLRDIIKSIHTQTQRNVKRDRDYKELLEKVIRYHNLDDQGGNTLYQLVIDADLQPHQ